MVSVTVEWTFGSEIFSSQYPQISISKLIVIAV
ncbi:uncharacterized protein METZ01_LOCUS215476 [marine metagenome]|uniref:Uncharacterized protein n=1 Tax=marine metagenome TaxID=408172 RepID=A0A382FJ19_9ZZZZ